jgi:hypothetical protein
MAELGPCLLKVPDGVLVRSLGGELVILDLNTSCCFGLDEVGAKMFEAVVEMPSIDAAVEALSGEFDAAPGQIRRDLDELVSKLLQRGLLESTDD